MDDIGSTDDTALLCHTNQHSRRLSEGDWLVPNGTKVGNYAYSTPRDVPGFGRTRGPNVVRLKRSSDGTPPEGMYKCVVRDTTDTNQTVYVGISSSVRLSSSMLTGDSVTRTSSIFKTSEVDVTIPSSTTESTTSTHVTPTQTVVYTSSEGTTTPTQTVVYSTSGEFKTPNLPFYYNSSATPTQTAAHTFSEGSTQTVVYSTKETFNSTGVVFSLQTLTPTEPNLG